MYYDLSLDVRVKIKAGNDDEMWDVLEGLFATADERIVAFDYDMIDKESYYEEIE